MSALLAIWGRKREARNTLRAEAQAKELNWEELQKRVSWQGKRCLCPHSSSHQLLSQIADSIQRALKGFSRSTPSCLVCDSWPCALACFSLPHSWFCVLSRFTGPWYLTPGLGCMLCHLQEAVCPPLYPALPPGVWFGGFLPVSTFSPRG